MSAAPKRPAKKSILAYEDKKFLDSDDGRPLRILSEYLGPLSALRRNKIQSTVVFFGSARLREKGPLGRFYAEARELAGLVTRWSKSVSKDGTRLLVCSGGGPGIMEAANRGAADAGGKSLGLNIGLPREQRPNPFITPELNFEFHYFFMRKLWMTHLARGIVAFPGGFGTLDELCEVITLSQTKKLDRRICIVLYGSQYWREIINFEALVRHGVIAAEDMNLFRFADDPATALRLLQDGISFERDGRAPAIAKSKTRRASGA